jgi:tetraacyldisaccharide 4'-kinase
VTTEKDMARIRSDARLASSANGISTLKVTLEFEDEGKLRSLVQGRISHARGV